MITRYRSFVIRPLSFALRSLLVLAVLGLTAPLYGQDSVVVREKVQRLRLDITGGYGVRLVGNVLRSPPDLNYKDGGYSIIGRLNWKPEYLISLGIESGWMPLGSVSADTVKGNGNSAAGTIRISTVPIFFVVSTTMFFGLEISGGIGAYSLNSTGALQRGGNVESQAWDIGYMGGLAWTLDPKGFPFGIGLDLRVMQFTDRPITMVMPGVRLRWKVKEW